MPKKMYTPQNPLQEAIEFVDSDDRGQSNKRNSALVYSSCELNYEPSHRGHLLCRKLYNWQDKLRLNSMD